MNKCGAILSKCLSHSHAWKQDLLKRDEMMPAISENSVGKVHVTQIYKYPCSVYNQPNLFWEKKLLKIFHLTILRKAAWKDKGLSLLRIIIWLEKQTWRISNILKIALCSKQCRNHFWQRQWGQLSSLPILRHSGNMVLKVVTEKRLLE